MCPVVALKPDVKMTNDLLAGSSEQGLTENRSPLVVQGITSCRRPETCVNEPVPTLQG